MTLAEIMVAIAVGSTVLAAGTEFFVQSLRSSAAVVNYYDMDNSSRSALSRMTKEIRQADRLTTFSDIPSYPRPNATDPYYTSLMVFTTTDPNTSAVIYFKYTYDPANHTLTRTSPCASDGSSVPGGQDKVLLKGCQQWKAAFFQRTPVGGTYDQYPLLADGTQTALCKVVQLTWNCSRKVSGLPVNTEGVQSAKVVMRKP